VKSDRWVTREHFDHAAKVCNNWGKWGAEDQIGTLNYITPESIIAAAKLVRRGAPFPLSIPLDNTGPQEPNRFTRRHNPVHTMLATGADVVAGVQLLKNGSGYADCAISLPTQCSTQWDALAHVFHEYKMYNGFGAELVNANGAAKNGIEHTIGKMIGRGVLLDVARHQGIDVLADGEAITPDDLDKCVDAQRVEIKTGDFVIVRTGQMEGRLARGSWDKFCGGDAPGLSFDTCFWLHDKKVAAICIDTWGCEVLPNETNFEYMQPWHAIVLPGMGITMGEIFYLKDLAADCAKDKVYEFLFTAPPLNITGGCGSPITPLAVK
jgi:kynurenine formamidase